MMSHQPGAHPYRGAHNSRGQRVNSKLYPYRVPGTVTAKRLTALLTAKAYNDRMPPKSDQGGDAA